MNTITFIRTKFSTKLFILIFGSERLSSKISTFIISYKLWSQLTFFITTHKIMIF